MLIKYSRIMIVNVNFVYIWCKSAKIYNLIRTLSLVYLAVLLKGFFIMPVKKSIINGKLRCPQCKLDKPTNEFFKSSIMTSGYSSWCKNCDFLKKRIRIDEKHSNLFKPITNLNRETWRSVPDYEGIYEISNLGRIKSLDRSCTDKRGRKYFLYGKLMKQKTTSFNYQTISLSKTSKSKDFFIHKLVALAFIPNPENKKEVNHINGIKSDNTVFNLEWCTRSENNRHAIDTGLLVAQRGVDRYNSKLTEEQVIRIKKAYKKNPKLHQKKLAEEMGICRKALNSIVKGHTWKHITI